MTEEIDKNYVAKYLERAAATDSEAAKNDCLYRVGSHMEIIACNGNSDDLTPQQKERILKTANELLGTEE